MKKPDAKKSYSNFKSGGNRNNFERAPRSERETLRKPYKNKKTAVPYVAKAPYVAHAEKPVYKGKESRLAGATRNETRIYSGYSARTTHGSSPRAYITKKVEIKEIVKPAQTTSWGSVAEWYDSHLLNLSDTYHEKVIMPRLFRMMGDVVNKNVLDLACGQGHLSRVLTKGGARVTGIDISAELISFAEIKNEEEKVNVKYFATPSDDLSMIPNISQDDIICVLAIQNIEKVSETIKECSRVLRKNGRLFIVINHPSFRIPQSTFWGYDEVSGTQFRRVDKYLSEAKIKIDMNPGQTTGKKFTVSFHRPLQFYSKILEKNNFAITRLEEWESHKKSAHGPRQKAEDTARKEIPMFMCIEAKKTEGSVAEGRK